MSARGPAVLASDRQLERGAHVLGLFLVVWGGMFAGIPLAMLFLASGKWDGAGVIAIFTLLGSIAFLNGLYLVLRRRTVVLDARGVDVEERSSFLGSARITRHPLRLFDCVSLTVDRDRKGYPVYSIALRGPGNAAVSLGDFGSRNEALDTGARAARLGGVALEELREDGRILRVPLEELAQVPAANDAHAELPWWRRPSEIALVVANLVPAWGVAFLGWRILPVVLLFWLENLVIGVFNIAKMVLARGEMPEDPSVPRMPAPVSEAGGVGLAVFFTFHYGMFCAVHGLFLVALFGRDEPGVAPGFDMPDLPRVVADLVFRHGLVWAVVALIASHGVNFYLHFLKPRAYEDASPSKLMFEPYKRVVILHVVLFAGAFAATQLGASMVPLLLLIVLKIVLDLAAQRRGHALPAEHGLRDFLEQHAERYVVAPALAVAPGKGDASLGHFLGFWAATPGSDVSPDWIARTEFFDKAGKVKARLWSKAGPGLVPEGEFEAGVRASGGQVQFLEVRQVRGGQVCIARFTRSAASPGCLDLNEIQYPEGHPNALHAKALTLQRA